MADFGVTDEGFTIKGLDVIVGESFARARQMFGESIDLTATSPLRKILETAAAEDAELWKRMEDLYYSGFVSTAIGQSLDLLGEDVGLQRRQLFAEGEIVFKLVSPAPGRQYVVPEGAIVVTAGGAAFYTLATITLSAAAPQQTAPARAFERGPRGDIAASTIVGIDPLYQQFYLALSGATQIQASNPRPFTGGAAVESDEVYRQRLLGLPRTIWTLESVRRAVLDVDGVIDVLLFDPLGGVDVSQSYFNMFSYDQRLFSGERRLGEPYFFDVVVAHEVAWPWRATGAAPGVYERVQAAIERVRPIGIHPSVIQANHIEVGVRAKLIIERGYDQQALLAAITSRVAADISALKLGGDVLASQVMRAFIDQPGVLDVQNLHLRRCPAALGRITFGAVPFQDSVIEAAVGENLTLEPTEIAVFRTDSKLIDLEVTPR
jgi:uncharacterized phage protein gp47/JayE